MYMRPTRYRWKVQPIVVRVVWGSRTARAVPTRNIRLKNLENFIDMTIIVSVFVSLIGPNKPTKIVFCLFDLQANNLT